MSAGRRHLVLLGDSIFDNAAYTSGEPDVASHLRSILPQGWTCSLAAQDGAVAAHVPGQLRRMPGDATHLALSAGGNDALANYDLLTTPVRSTGDALELFSRRLAAFEAEYIRVLDLVQATGLPATVCTIYNGALPNPAEARRARVALTLFNDVILRSAWTRGFTIVELRLVCTEPADYANPIEPSGEGGRKIARAVARAAGAVAEAEPAAYARHGARV